MGVQTDLGAHTTHIHKHSQTLTCINIDGPFRHVLPIVSILQRTSEKLKLCNAHQKFKHNSIASYAQPKNM